MTDDQGFIDALLERPMEDATRLVYADWLDEHGDPRGEFLRLLVEAARNSQFGAGRRLNAIRHQLDAEWVEVVTRPNEIGVEWSNDRTGPRADLLIDRRRFGLIFSASPPTRWLFLKPDSLFDDLPKPTWPAVQRQVVFGLWATIRVGKHTVTWSDVGGPIAPQFDPKRHTPATLMFRRDEYTRTLRAALKKGQPLYWQVARHRR
jgi:uncharacterized protein (TIGR02996 family)